MGAVLVRAENRHPPDHPRDPDLVAGIDEFKGAWRASARWRLTACRPCAGWPPSRASAHPPASRAASCPTGTSSACCPTCRSSPSHPRRAGGGRLCRGHGTGVLVLAGHPADREPHQAAAPRSCCATARRTPGIAATTRPPPTASSPSTKHGKQLGVVFETATPFDTPRLMTELVDLVERGARGRAACTRCCSSASGSWCSWRSTPSRTATAA